jgi:putative ABC transport system permease protein
MTEFVASEVAAAVRRLAVRPGTSIAAVLLLAVAVGLNLAVFGLIDRAILSPAQHLRAPESVFTLAFEVPGTEPSRGRMTTTSYVVFETIRNHVPALEGAAAWRRASTSAIVAGDQIRAEAMMVSGSYFAVVGASPSLGRAIQPADDRDSIAAPVAVLGHTFWRSAFGSDPSVLGRRLTLGGIEYTVVGVMPAGFSGHSAAHVDVWMPFAAAMRGTPGWDRDALRNITSILVRVRAGESASVAAAQASAAIERRVALVGLAGADIAPAERRIAYALAGVSILVLIVGLANAATLLLVRGARRRRETAIRAALGASRRRLLSESVVEAAVFAAVATAGALVLAYWFDEAVRRQLLAGVAELTALNTRTIVAAALAGLGALALAAVVGFVQTPRRVQAEDLAGTGRVGRRKRAYAALLFVQTTLSVVLIAGAGMFGRSLHNLASQDFGMRLENVLLVNFERGPGFVPNQRQIFTDALERIRDIPGIELAAPMQVLPFSGFHVLPVGVPGRAQAPNVDGQLPFLIAATPELFEILGVEIVEGRRFNAADERGAPVVIVNETMARTVWPGESALGKCIRIGFDPSFDPFSAAGPPGPPVTVPCREVIGVAHDMRQRSVLPTGSESRLMQYFVPFGQVPPPPGAVVAGPGISGLVLRTSVDADGVSAAVRRAVLGDRTDLPFLEVRPYAQLLERQMQPWRTGTVLFALFGGLALTVAAMGLYAAFAHAVGERHREMAIRIAIGARPQGVLAMILREANRLALVGVVCGCAAAAAGGRWLESMLFGTAPSDPIVLGAAAALMLLVAAVATYLPARTASRANPTSLLRAE